MVHAFTASEGFALLALLFVAGLFGLRMCRATLRSPTAIALRMEAVFSMLKQDSYSSLSTPQRAVVLAALYASETPPELSTQRARSRGLHNTQRCIDES